MQSEHSLFELLVLSLGNAALIALGLISEPGTQYLQKNLDAVKSNIDLLEMLNVKTKNNLTNAEQDLLSQLIYDLKIKYVEAQKHS